MKKSKLRKMMKKKIKKVPFPLLLEIHALKSTKRKGKYLKIENKHNRFGHNIMEWNFNELHVQFKTFFEKGHCHLLAGIILQKHFLQRDLLYWVYSWIFAPLCSISFLETVKPCSEREGVITNKIGNVLSSHGAASGKPMCLFSMTSLNSEFGNTNPSW